MHVIAGADSQRVAPDRVKFRKLLITWPAYSGIRDELNDMEVADVAFFEAVWSGCKNSK